MPVNESSMPPDSDDDLPDFSTPEWQAKFARAPLRRGRPKSDVTKVRTTLRLDPDVLAAFRSGGPGRQTRINDALRKAVGLP